MKPRIGVLALQGDFREHAQMLRRLGAEAIEVRMPEQLAEIQGLVIPGGESTTMMHLARLNGLDKAIAAFDKPLFGTCAGMILMDRHHLGLTDIAVERNAYGRQAASFEANIELKGEAEPVHAVFIRAPQVKEVGAGIEVLARLDGEPVLMRDSRHLLAAFHPELTDDSRIHALFLGMVSGAQNGDE